MKQRIYIPFLVACALFFSMPLLAQLQPEAVRQIQSLIAEKASRTPVEQKIESQLLQGLREFRGQRMVAGVNLEKARVNADNNGSLKVDITATVSNSLLARIKAAGGNIIYASVPYNSIRAQISLSQVETIAAWPEVRFIQPAVLAETVGSGAPKQASPSKVQQSLVANPYNKNGGFSLPRPTVAERSRRVREAIKKYLQERDEYNPLVLNSGSVNSQGDRAHRADDARNAFGCFGQGIKIGVISDSYNSLGAAPADVTSGDLPGTGNPNGNTTPVTVVADITNGSDEGRAMLQIVHDLAPKAQLFFATAFISEASFADNIVALRTTYNCDIIIDDIFYYDEPVFQDGIVAQAVNTVTASGALYFSSAGNEGSVAKNTAGVWEGDFKDAGSPAFTFPGGTKSGTIHNFGTVAAPVNGNIITTRGNVYNLNWADPAGASANDYDLFLVSAAGTVKASSTNVQSGTQNPYEQISPTTLVNGDRLVVFKTTGAQVRAFSVNTIRGRLTVATTGQVHGHTAAADAFSVAATPAAAPFSASTTPGPFPGVFTTANQVESFSSDGLRRIFFNANGTPVTPGNFLFGTNGGTVRMKPDITAADGVSTTLASNSGLNPFYGTSAAAPHAGAIAALIKSVKPNLTPAQIRNILITTALDIESSGYDNVSGYGILQAYQSLVASGATPIPLIQAGAATITAQSCMPGNGVIDPGETVTVSFCVQNNGGAATTNLVGTLQNTGGVTFASGPQNYGVVPTGGSQVCRPFTFTASGACGSTITASINLQDGATNLGTVTYTFTLGVITQNPAVVTTNNTSITIPATAGASTPYPSNITVSGITNPVTKVTVQLNGLNHTFPDDLDILLVSPTGQKVILMSDAGAGTDVINANLIFDDAATAFIPDAGPIPSNTTTTYKPTNYAGTGTETFPSPAPVGPYAATLSSFNGLAPNGTWSLYVVDDEAVDAGSITGGWTLNITTSTASCCVTPPPVITAPTVTQPTCTTSTGTIVVNATGSGTLEYSIDNGTTYQLSNTFSGLAPGNYNIKVRQQANPSNSTTYSANPVVINAVPAAPATPTVMVTQPSCTAPAGSITVTAPSGAGITYSINGTTYQASNIFNNLTPGNYSVTAKNSSGCVSMATPVTINMAPTAGPAAPTVTVTQPTCSSPSGSITVTAPTGSGITYSINGTTYQAGTTFSNVSPGSYNVTAKNSSGCVSAATPVTINATPSDNQPPVIPTNLTVFLNANSQATVTPTSVAPLITDNCAVDPNSITVSANSFTCANITGSSTYQPFVATNSIGNQNADEEQGMDFRVNAASGIVITQLGAFDHQANGLMGTQPDGNGGMGIRVAIFNKANQMIVPGLDVVITGNGDAFSGNYRYKNIPAVTLPPGDYLVLAKGYNANELMGNVYLGGGPYPQGDNAGGAISFLNTAFYDGSATPGFTYPAQSVNTGTSNIFKGGTFTYALSQSNTVTISAADYAGNQSQVVANVMVVDTMYILATKNITVNLNSSGQATIQPRDVLQSYKNKCSIDVISSTLQVSPSNFTCADVGNVTLSSPHQPFIAINATGNQNADEEQGMDFRVNAAGGIVLTQLGAFDHQANGLIGTQSDGNGGMGIRVAIFNKANQMIVPGLDVVITGNGDAFAGNYRYKNIAAVTLPPGDYLVLAKGYNANELMGNVYLGGGPYPQGDNANGAISFLNTAYYDGSATPGFTYPTDSVNTGTSNIFKGGTFTYKTKMASGTLVTLTATDVYGNQKQATANVTVTDFNNVCTPAPIAASAKAAPVMAGKVSPAQQPKEQIEVEKLSIYPNPSQGAFNVQLSHVSGSKLSVEIRDGNGKVVAVKAVPLGSKTQTLTVPFDLGSQASGMYWIRVVSATGVQTTKVLLQR